MNDFTHFTLVKIFTNTCPFVFGGNMCLRLCTAVIFYTSMRLSGPKWGKTGRKGRGKSCQPREGPAAKIGIWICTMYVHCTCGIRTNMHKSNHKFGWGWRNGHERVRIVLPVGSWKTHSWLHRITKSPRIDLVIDLRWAALHLFI